MPVAPLYRRLVEQGYEVHSVVVGLHGPGEEAVEGLVG